MEKSRGASKEEQHVHTAVFAIIIGVLMACFKRVLVVSLVEQWRAYIFLLLNLILLAVVFTSLRCSGSNPCNSNDPHDQKRENNPKENKEDMSCSVNSKVEICQEVTEKEEEVEVEEEEKEVELTEEELNQRVEAFIAMFRQHLVLDSRRKSRISAQKTATLVK